MRYASEMQAFFKKESARPSREQDEHQDPPRGGDGVARGHCASRRLIRLMVTPAVRLDGSSVLCVSERAWSTGLSVVACCSCARQGEAQRGGRAGSGDLVGFGGSLVDLLVNSEVRGLREGLVADVADVGLGLGVDASVAIEVGAVWEALAAFLAGVGFALEVDVHVVLEGGGVGEALGAAGVRAGELTLVVVGLEVLVQAGGSGEGLLAQVARVRSAVSMSVAVVVSVCVSMHTALAAAHIIHRRGHASIVQ